MEISKKQAQLAVVAVGCIGITYYLHQTYFNKNKVDKDEKGKKKKQ